MRPQFRFSRKKIEKSYKNSMVFKIWSKISLEPIIRFQSIFFNGWPFHFFQIIKKESFKKFKTSKKIEMLKVDQNTPIKNFDFCVNFSYFLYENLYENNKCLYSLSHTFSWTYIVWSILWSERPQQKKTIIWSTYWILTKVNEREYIVNAIWNSKFQVYF